MVGSGGDGILAIICLIVYFIPAMLAADANGMPSQSWP